MAHFAEIENGIVKRVIVAGQDFIASGLVGDPQNWFQTSEDMAGGVNKLGGTPLRKNYAGVGYKYDKKLDAFVPPKPYPSWILDKITCLWKAPKVKPDDGKSYRWNESILNWELN